MSVITRQADLGSDRELIISFLREHLTPESDEERFEWLYLSCPAGRALARIAVDVKLQKVIGVAAAFPRQIKIGADPATGWVLGDFCIAPEYRSGGPALALQRSLIDDVCRTQAALYYDFPSAGMMAIYRRLRVREFGGVTRYVRHLRAEPIVRRILPHPALYKPVAALLDLVASPSAAGSQAGPRLEIQVVDQAFTAEFSDLDRQISSPDYARVARTAEYLNWRFRAQPHRSYRVMTARRSGKLAGFLVFLTSGDAATIVDLTAVDNDVAQQLICATTRYLRGSTPAKIANFPLLSGSRLAGIAVESGFRAREVVPFVLAAAAKEGLPARFMEPRNWILTGGDRDS